MSKKPFKILIVRTDRIGDVILTLPAVAALRRHFPDSHITMMVAPIMKVFLDGHPDIDAILINDLNGIRRGTYEFIQQFMELRRHKFDLAVVFHTKRWTNSLCAWAGIPRRIGYEDNKFGFFLTERVVDERHLGQKHEAEYCLELLQRCGIPTSLTAMDFRLNVSDENIRWAADWCAKRGISSGELILLNPSASNPVKEWPVERFAMLTRRIRERSPFPLGVIGVRNCPAAAALLKKINGTNNIHDLSGQTSLGQLMGLLKNSRILISNDSGPVHLAAALDVPVVSIFTRDDPGVNPQRWRPLGARSRYVVSKSHSGTCERTSSQEQPKDVDEEAVTAVLQSVDALCKLC